MIRSEGIEGAYERRRGSLSCSVFKSFCFRSGVSSSPSTSASVVSGPEGAGVGVAVAVAAAEGRFRRAAAPLEETVAGVELRVAVVTACFPFCAAAAAEALFPNPCTMPVPLPRAIAASSSSRWFAKVFCDCRIRRTFEVVFALLLRTPASFACFTGTGIWTSRWFSRSSSAMCRAMAFARRDEMSPPLAFWIPRFRLVGAVADLAGARPRSAT